MTSAVAARTAFPDQICIGISLGRSRPPNRISRAGCCRSMTRYLKRRFPHCAQKDAF